MPLICREAIPNPKVHLQARQEEAGRETGTQGLTGGLLLLKRRGLKCSKTFIQ